MKKILLFIFSFAIIFSTGCTNNEMEAVNEQLIGGWEIIEDDMSVLLYFDPDGSGFEEMIFSDETLREDFTWETSIRNQNYLLNLNFDDGFLTEAFFQIEDRTLILTDTHGHGHFRHEFTRR